MAAFCGWLVPPVLVRWSMVMGKGARNRAKRERRISDTLARQAIREAIGDLLLVEDLGTFMSLLEQHPELKVEAAIDELREASASPGYGPLFGRALALLEGARKNPAGAWEAYRKACNVAAKLGEELEELHAEIEAANGVREFARVLELIERALPIASEAGYGMDVCELLGRRGLALYNLSTELRGLEIDAAIEAFELALEVAVSGEQAARLLMHLGLAYGERVNGDRADNIDRATVALRAGLEQLESSDDEELRAMMQTNLAVVLTRGERGDRAAAVHEAADLCRDALIYRSPERGADNWAYSQLNLGNALQDVAALGDGDMNQARAAYLQVVAQQGAITDKSLMGAAHHALGRLELGAAHQTAEDILDAHEAGELDQLYDTTPALQAALVHLEGARELTSETEDRLRYGRILDNLSEALEQLGEAGQAIEVAREALRVLRPTTAPEACKNVAWRLGTLLGEEGDWDGAAAAFREAVEAAEFTFHARMETPSRDAETRRTGNLHRWAAYALARAGDPAGAALVLESGRGRELRRRLGLRDIDEEALADVPPALRDEYQSAVRALLASPMDANSAQASRRMQEALTAIRQLPGLAHFGTGPQWAEITGAIEPGWPLLYVNPTPSGTLILGVWSSEQGVTADALFVDDTTSTQVFLRLMAGDAAELDNAERENGGEFGSYLLGISGQGRRGRDFRRDLDQALPWLGEAIARPLHDVLAAHGAKAATLVLCGPVAVAPLHTAPWHAAGAPRCLADEFDIRYAPSAVVCATVRRRAETSEKKPRRLVALADPSGDLPATRAEVKEIAALFKPDCTRCAVGARADDRFLLRHASEATHLHLACHARGGLFDAAEAGIMLASGPLAATKFTMLASLSTRLVVVSACQSAQSEIAGLPDEALSIATAMLASGTACAVASLWPVDDLATALLMTRLYQEMMVDGQRPPEALRRAQLWLRNLSEEDEQRFLDRHPALAAESRRRVAEGDQPGRRGGEGGGARLEEGPYAHLDFWAPFIAVGV